MHEVVSYQMESYTDRMGMCLSQSPINIIIIIILSIIITLIDNLGLCFPCVCVYLTCVNTIKSEH